MVRLMWLFLCDDDEERERASDGTHATARSSRHGKRNDYVTRPGIAPGAWRVPTRVPGITGS